MSEGAEELGRALQGARARLAAITEQGLPALEAWRTARGEVLALERRLAAARGEEHLVPLADVPAWEPGAPEPRLLLGCGLAVLVYHVADGGLGVVELRGVRAARTTPIDDATLAKHALAGRGLEAGTAQRVEGSRWAADLGGRHYAFWFHDEAVELVAREHEALVTDDALADVLASLARRLAGP